MWADTVIGAGLALIGIIVVRLYDVPGEWLGIVLVVAGTVVALGTFWAEA
jgi:hypothetical protein